MSDKIVEELPKMDTLVLVSQIACTPRASVHGIFPYFKARDPSHRGGDFIIFYVTQFYVHLILLGHPFIQFHSPKSHFSFVGNVLSSPR